MIGVEFDAKDPGNFLEDPERQGFERLGSVLTLSPSNIEKYLAAAAIILNEAYPKPPPPLRLVVLHNSGRRKNFGTGMRIPALYFPVLWILKAYCFTGSTIREAFNGA